MCKIKQILTLCLIGSVLCSSITVVQAEEIEKVENIEQNEIQEEGSDAEQNIPTEPSGNEDTPSDIPTTEEIPKVDSETDEPILETRALPYMEHQAYVGGEGWQPVQSQGQIIGTVEQHKVLEAFKITLSGIPELGIQYAAQVAQEGWQKPVSDGETAGTEGQGLPLEGIQINLTGNAAALYTVWYRVHISNIGWSEWTGNGEVAGNIEQKPIEAIEAIIGYAGEEAPIETNALQQPEAVVMEEPSVTYTAHVGDLGWQPEVSNGTTGGTVGRNKGLEAICVQIKNRPDLGVQYAAHVAEVGWQPEVTNGAVAGTVGKALNIEALQFQLTGSQAINYDIWYRVHTSDIGWLGWTKNGSMAGTAGMCLKMEAVEIRILPKDSGELQDAGDGYIQPGTVSYQAHISDMGWQSECVNGAVAGTTGMCKALEAVKITSVDQTMGGGIEYRAHVSDLGWQEWVQEGGLAGTTGRAKPMEAIQVRLQGAMNRIYDVYYRVHSQEFGWLAWTYNGQPAGTEGYAYRIEALQIRLIPKNIAGKPAVGTAFHKYEIPTNRILSVPMIMQYPELPSGCEVTALTMALNYHGFGVSKLLMADNFLPKVPYYRKLVGGIWCGPDMQNNFVGNPRGTGWVCESPALVTAANRYFQTIGSRNYAKNVSGSSFEDLYSWVRKGNPVVFCGTIGMAPRRSPQSWFVLATGSWVSWSTNDHGLVLSGVSGGNVVVNDPIRGRMTVSKQTFERSYAVRGYQALVIQ